MHKVSHGYCRGVVFCPGACGKRAVTFLICHCFLSYVPLGHGNQGIGSIVSILITGSQGSLSLAQDRAEEQVPEKQADEDGRGERECMDMVYTYIDV